MKILRSWLADHLAITEHHTDDDIADACTSVGMEVGSVLHVDAAVPGVVTATVRRTASHPDAASVQRVWVDTGDGAQRHVWCGASNFGPGDVVALATVGTAMPDGRTIEPRRILGVASEGMLCSAAELGLGADHSGILVLPAGTAPGLRYGEALGLRPDVVFDLDLTRNRPDAWGYVGVARDLAPRLGVAFTPPIPARPALGPTATAPVDLIAGDACGRFTSTVLSGVEVGPSAEWMAARLAAVGMRAVNNVVDVSNYVMLELNRPNHAYDLERLGGGGLRIRMATERERMVTLDGENRALRPTDLLICDGSDVPVGIAGIMGGLDSEIVDATTTVVLEMAWFEPTGIARSASGLRLRSEASARNERGIDPYGIELAVHRFAELLAETCADLVVHDGMVDRRGRALPPADRSCPVRLAVVARVMAVEVPAPTMARLLDPIGFTVAATDHTGVVDVALPSWRPDSVAEIDVVEEVARHYGYDRIGKRVPRPATGGGLTVAQQRRRLIRQVMLGLGISEAMPNPFLGPTTLAAAGLEGDVLRITNPLAADESVLRTSLRPGLLRAVAYNESHRRRGARLFEIGHVYPPGAGELPDETEWLTVVLAGADAGEAMAVWRELAAELGVGARIDQERVPPGLHRGRSATLVAGREPLGTVGEVAPGVLQAFDVSERVAIVEVDLTRVLARDPKPATWKPVSRFPSSDVDLAFVLADSVPAEKLEKAIRHAGGERAVDVVLFDVYRGQGVGVAQRSLTYRVRVQAADRSLTDADLRAVRARVVAAAAKLGARLRGQ